MDDTQSFSPMVPPRSLLEVCVCHGLAEKVAVDA